MRHQDFIEYAKKHYAEQINTANSPLFTVFEVWSVKCVGNSKVILADNITPYLCEVSMNGEKQEIYFDYYKKVQKETVNIDA